MAFDREIRSMMAKDISILYFLIKNGKIESMRPFLDKPNTNKEKVTSHASSQYLMLNSADRILTYGSFQKAPNTTQPWNNFKLQKMEPLMEAFAKRIVISEINFPMCIPNITSFNNTFRIISTATGNVYDIAITNNFYTPAEIVTAVNVKIVYVYGQASEANPPVLSYNETTMAYTLSTAGGNAFKMVFTGESTYYNTASLYKTLGFQYSQQNVNIAVSVTGAPTLSQYTSYIDVTSDRLMRFTNVDDSDSNGYKSKSRLFARLYLTDDNGNSMITVSNKLAPITSRPFIISRQFKNAKHTKWDPDSFIDYFDIQVLDQYGNLVYMPSANIDGTNSTTPTPYPDFQLTLLASE